MRHALQAPLRTKILFILGCYVLGIMVVGYISYDDLRTTREKIEILELADNLNNTILEIRRYEKNFLLYQEQEAFRENGKYLNQAKKTVASISTRASRLKLAPILETLNGDIRAYAATMNLLAEGHRPEKTGFAEIVDRLREQGKRMTDMGEHLVAFERDRIHQMLSGLQTRLLTWSALAVLFGIIIPLLVIFRIVKPLSIIKRATEDIARGRFKRIEVMDTRDEMQQVMEAFNTMVREVERRQEQLVQSQKLSALGTLTAGVAHQLNNPLHNISTSCQIAIEEIDDADRQFLLRMLENVEREILRARDVVKGLLEFSRVQEFARRPVNISGLVKRSVQLVHSQVPADIDIETDIPEDLVLSMDAQRMQEVFLNLLINASQAIPGSGRITVTAREDGNTDCVVIEVHDTGAGIPEEIRPRIFDPFYTTKEEGQGTGLGLSVVYGIIKKHHGTITVESEPGSGTSFFIRLPRTMEAPERTASLS